MPTENHAKVRNLLKTKKAKVIKRCPFTIQLAYDSTNYTQPINLGIDAGSKHIGVSATTEDKVLYEADVELRNDVVKLLATRRENRRARRNHKTRYRKARFDNRRRGDGWIAPSIREKIDTHLTTIANVHKILPITKITVETAQFDIQKIKNPDIEGAGYQQGEQLGFWNVREYVLSRDGHKCQCCKGKSKDKILNVHHIESRKTGGDAPNNLITLCETCHTGYHKGTVKLPKTIRRGMSFRDATFMGIMRWAFYNKLKEIYPNVSLTYGYITKNTRIKNNLPKDHYIDARCISGNPKAVSDGTVYYQKKVRCHNRRIHKNTILKGGYRKRNQAPYEVMGFRLYDKVKWKTQNCFIFGRRSTGYMDLRSLDGTKINTSVRYKNLRLLEMRKNTLIEIRKVG
jgi:N6-L-threonylcarbamoyladenine synthase